jgi:hypothetical protein
MLYVLMIHIVMDIFKIVISMIKHILYVSIIMLIYGIKMVRKMPIILTRTITLSKIIVQLVLVATARRLDRTNDK